MYALAQKLLFCLDPELSHELSLDWIGAAHRLRLLDPFLPDVQAHPVEVMGLTFPNPIGMAAGLDKNGDYLNALGRFGFGFIEVGTVTPRAQAGNPLPRLFRLPEQHAIINRMGFNNKGVDHLVENVKRRKYDGVLGINIGKNKMTPEASALDDYIACLDAVYAHADYVTINISSPNTPGLRNLQFGENLKALLNGIKKRQSQLELETHKRVPIAVKIAPDMQDDEIKSIADTLVETRMDAVIATNTTVSRMGVENMPYASEMGGLSGSPLTETSTHVISVLSEHLRGSLPIIGVGGVMCGEDAQNKIAAGASLVQVYSGFIYRGPSLVSEAADAIASALQTPPK